MKIILILCLLLASCGGMSRQEVIAATKECRDAGMKEQLIINAFDYSTQRVECYPLESK